MVAALFFSEENHKSIISSNEYTRRFLVYEKRRPQSVEEILVYAAICGIWCFIFGSLAHLVYRYIIVRKNYTRVTAFEILFILLGVVPGLAGCGQGSFGFGVPAPMLLGVLINIVMLANDSCGWAPVMWKDGEYIPEKISDVMNAEIGIALFVFALYVVALFCNYSA